MHRHGVFFVASLAIVSLGAASPAFADAPTFDLSPIAAPPSTPMSYLAPADEEFGQYHLTPLGIVNAINAAGSRFTDSSSRDELSGGSFALAIDSIHAWQHAYPHDPGIPRALARIAHVYARLHNDWAHEYASRTVAWIERDYPGSHAARNARTELDVAMNDARPAVDDTFAHLEQAPPPQPVATPEGAWQHYDNGR